MVVVLTIVALGVVLAVTSWDWMNAGEESPGPTVRTVSLIVGGAVAVVLTLWRSTLSERQWQVAQESLLNQRYERAAEMLGSRVPVVRVAGVQALKNLADEHPSLYHLQIIDLLCAYIRSPPEYEDDLAISLVNDNPDIRPIVREDVQVAFRAVAHRSTAGIEIERRRGYRLDLAKTDLRGMDAGRGGDLSSANLQETDLRHATLYEMNLSRANLLGAELAHCYLARANLHNADMNGTDMSFCYAEFADLSGATLGIEMRAIELGRANLSNATLLAPNMTSADLLNTNLTGANFAAVSGSKREVSPTGEEYNTEFLTFARLTQHQLDLAVADPDNPPTIPVGTVDIETGEQLVWRGGTIRR